MDADHQKEEEFSLQEVLFKWQDIQEQFVDYAEEKA
jgi:hypothetical protein